MRHFIIICLGMFLFFINVFAYGLSGTYNGFFKGYAEYSTSTFTFFENTYEMQTYFDDDTIPQKIKNEVVQTGMGWEYNERGTFELKENNGIFYIEWNNSKILSKYIILFNEIQMYLLDNNEAVFSPGVSGNMANIFPNINDIKASSELRENRILYSANNMKRPGLPWVEGVKGYGIGETLTVKIWTYNDENFPDLAFRGFVISNGYVQFDKPDLFKKNSRVKSLEIISFNGTKREFQIADTSLFQTLLLPDNMLPTKTGTYEYKVIIKDVYRGDLWEDTCVNIIQCIVPYCYNEK